MSPIIFEAGTQNFDSLGLGLLPDGLKATVTEELNGKFTFEIIYPVDGRNYATLQINRIVKVNAGHGLLGQAFVIRQITQNIDMTVSVYAEHISYLSLDMALKPAQTFSNLTAQQALQAWKNQLVDDTPFVMYSDIPTLNNVTFGAPDFENARQALGGHVGSILDVWGGEYEFDNWYIRLWKQRGKVANTVISYGRNLTDLSQETSITDTYTSLYPYMVDKDQVKHFLPELVVDSQYVANYPNRKIMLIDFSSEFGQDESFSETKLRARATSYINSNNIGVPKVSFDVSAVDLSKSVDYTGEPEQIDLADTVSVYFEKLNINATAQVTEVVWNVLSEQYDSFKLGARRASLSSQIATVANDANTTAQQAKETANNAYQLSANGKHIIGYLDSGDPMPDNPKVGDTIFMKDGYDFQILEWDGITWVAKIDPNLSARLEETLETAKSEATQLIDDNMLNVSSVASSIASEASSLAVQKANFTSVASSYANAALTAANSARASMATSLASSAATQAASTAAAFSSAQSAASSVAASMVANGVSNVTSAYKTYTDSAVAVGVNTAKSYADGGISSTATQLNATATSLAASVTTVSSAASGGINSLATQLTATNSSFGASVTSLASKDSTLSTAIGSVAVTASTANVGVTSVASSVNSATAAQSSALSSAKSTLSAAIATGDSSAASSANSAVNSLSNSIGSQISTLSAGLTATNSQVALRATKSEVNTATGSLATAIGSVDVKANGISQTVTEMSTRINNLGQINQLFNTEFSPDFEGWQLTTTAPTGESYPNFHVSNTMSYDGSNVLEVDTRDQAVDNGIYTYVNVLTKIPVTGHQKMSFRIMGYIESSGLSANANTYFNKSTQFYNANGTKIAGGFGGSNMMNKSKVDQWQASNATLLNMTIPEEAAYWTITMYLRGTGKVYLSKPMLVFDSPTVGDYVPGQYNNTDRLALAELNIDSITNVVSNPTTGLTKRVQTAEGTLQTATNNITGLQTSQTQLSNQITTEVTNRQNGDANTLTQAQNYTQSQITNATTTLQSSITQSANAITASIDRMNRSNLVVNSAILNKRMDGWTEENGGSWYAVAVSYYGTGALGNTAAGLQTTESEWVYFDNTALSASVAYKQNPADANSNLKIIIQEADASKNVIGETILADVNAIGTIGWTVVKKENIPITSGRKYVRIKYQSNGTVQAWYVAQPMIVGTTTLPPSGYIDGPAQSTNTTLSLLSDSYSFGINSSGQLISGISGNQIAVTLTGKAITLNGDTNVLGTFKVGQANISNAAIGTAQIADIAITSAKIASLDVNKLTGNITNFIQSNWNGIYGSVSITSSGMKVSTSGVTTDFNSSGMDLTLSGEFVGGIGVAHMQGMPDNYQGLNFQLNGVGDYMAWAARDNGVQTGNYPAKLVWYRGGSYTKPSGNFSGFTFLDTVTFAEHINVAGGTSQRISFGTNTFNNNPYPYIGDSRGKAGFAYGLTETYLISDNHYYNASKVIRALANLGDWKLPKSINSSGIVTEWYNMNT